MHLRESPHRIILRASSYLHFAEFGGSVAAGGVCGVWCCGVAAVCEEAFQKMLASFEVRNVRKTILLMCHIAE